MYTSGRSTTALSSAESSNRATNRPHWLMPPDGCQDPDDADPAFWNCTEKYASQYSRVRPTTDRSEIEDDFDIDKVVMSIFNQKNRMGIAVFDLHRNSVGYCSLHYFKEDSSALLSVILEYNPEVVLVSSLMDISVIDDLKNLLEASECSGRLEVTRPSEFNQQLAGTRLQLLQVRDSVITLDVAENMCAIRAIGACVGYVIQNKIVNELEHENSPIVLSQFFEIKISGRLLIDMASLDALQIFKDELHPSASGIGVRKEGLSLFGLLDKTSTTIGRKRLRQWFLTPSSDRELLSARLDLIEGFLAPERGSILNEVKLYLKQVKNAISICQRIRLVRSSLNDWVKLFRSLVNSLKIVEILRTCDDFDELQFLSKMFDPSCEDLLSLATELNYTVDFEQSQSENRLCPRDGFDDDLDHLRRLYNGLDSFLTELGTEEMELLSNTPIRTLKCCYFPQIGFQIAIPAEECTSYFDAEKSTIPETDFEFQFKTDSFFYFKNPTMSEVDSTVGDIYCSIVDMENRIIRNLEERIIGSIEKITDLFDSIAELDCIISLANAAHQYRLCRPTLVTENCICIESGRHLMHELCVPTFIPNDAQLGRKNEWDTCVSIITAANNSGKSVYLKQCGIIVFLAHIGSFVPAKCARIGLMNRIFTRIWSRETCTVNQSSFLIDCLAISGMLKNSSPKTFLLIDEFGKGTNEQDGEALLAALINHILRLGHKAPNTLIATHSRDLITSNAIVDKQKILSLKTMEVMLSDDSGEIVYLYTLREGSNKNSSCAFHVAAMAGINQELIERAQAVKECGHNASEMLLRSSGSYSRFSRIVDLFKKFNPDSGDLSVLFHNIRNVSNNPLGK